MLVAERMGDFTTIGIDCIAMNVNDLICVGAEPIALLDFILCRDANPEMCGAIGVGLRRGAELAGSRFPAARSPRSGDIVSGTELTGSAIGLVALDAIVDGSGVEPGDASSACPRAACTPTATRSPARSCSRRSSSTTIASADRSARSCSSRPRSTCAPILELLRSDGRRPRASPTSPATGSTTSPACGRRSATRSPTRSMFRPIFDLIAELGDVGDEEMYEVFNMGCGFVCVVARERRGSGPRAAARPLPGGEADRHRYRPGGSGRAALAAGARDRMVGRRVERCALGQQPRTGDVVEQSIERRICADPRDKPAFRGGGSET